MDIRKTDLTPADSILKRHFLVAQHENWIQYFIAAAKTYGFQSCVLMAVASRETNLDPKYLRVPGDKGNGFGLMQIDRRSYPAHCKSTDWMHASLNIAFGAKVLDEKRQHLLGHQGKLVTVKSLKKLVRIFRGAALQGEDLLRVMIASYNCGDWAHYHFTKAGRSAIDRGTTGADYSQDVISRAAFFAPFLGEKFDGHPYPLRLVQS